MTNSEGAPTETAVGPSWLHLALVAILVSALLIGPIVLLKRIDPEGPWQLMPIVVLFVTTESVTTRRWLNWPTRKRHRASYSFAELVILLALVPLFLWLANGRMPIQSTIIDLVTDPFAALSVPLVAYALLVVFAWERAHSWSGILIQLSISPHEVSYYSRSQTQRISDPSIVPPVKNRSALLHGFVQSWILGGIFLVIMVALVSFDLGSGSQGVFGTNWPTLTRLGVNQELLAALLVYFLVGLWLISQGRSAVLRGRWLAAGSRRDVNVLANWRRWALMVIIGLALLASFLPVGSTIPLLQIFQALGRFLITIIEVILALLTYLMFLVISLLPDKDAPNQPQPPPDLNQLFQPDKNPPAAPLAIPPLLAGSLFWLVLTGVVIAATLYFMKERSLVVSLDRMRFFLRGLFNWLRGMGQETTAAAAALATSLRHRLRRPSFRDSIPAPFGFLRVGSLPPKEQVRFLYLSLVRQAKKRGVPRPEASTPIEFVRTLESNWPEAGDDLEKLTDSFHAARYGRHDIDEGQLRSTKDAWRRVRRYFSQRAASRSDERES